MISLIDDVPDRDCIDMTCNRHGEALIDFLQEARLLVANGRVKGKNTFTSISAKGSSVIDYIALPHGNLVNCISFDVYPVSEVISDFGLESMLSERCKAPDHSIISLTYQMVNFDMESSEDSEKESTQENLSKRYNYGTMSDRFMNSASWLSILDTLIARIECIEQSQSSIDSFYNDMLQEIFSEMDSHINYKESVGC